MERREVTPRDWDDDERPRKPRRKPKKKSGSLVWVFVIPGVVVVAGIGGLVAFLVSRGGTGGGGLPAQQSAAETFAERFMGKWEGVRPSGRR